MRISVTPSNLEIIAATRVLTELTAGRLTEASKIGVIAQAIADAAEHAGSAYGGWHCHCSVCVKTCNCSKHR